MGISDQDRAIEEISSGEIAEQRALRLEEAVPLLVVDKEAGGNTDSAANRRRFGPGNSKVRGKERLLEYYDLLLSGL